jgi:DNA-binding NarL/FixJ family response regulator
LDYSAEMPIRLVLAEDSDFVRESVALLIDTRPDLELVAVCRDFDELSTAVARANPAVVLTDVRDAAHVHRRGGPGGAVAERASP